MSGEVVVRVLTASEGGGEVALDVSVTGSGVGIPRRSSGRSSTPFTQTDSSMTRTYGGTGLGLTVSTRLVELLGGRLSVESEVVGAAPSGSRRALPSRNHRRRAAAIDMETLADLRVLVVDDNATNRRILHDVLVG